MGGKKKTPAPPPAPTFTPSHVYQGDRRVSSTYLDNTGAIRTEYYEDPAEIERRNIVNPQINSILASLGVQAPEQVKQFDKMRDDYAGLQLDAFNKEYDRTFRGLQEDTAQRFGTLNATSFFDALKRLEQDVKTPAIRQINQQASVYRTDLANQAEAQKLNRLSALGYTLNQDQQRFIQNLGTSASPSQSINAFNQNNYSQQLQNFQFQQQLAQQKKLADQARNAALTRTLLTGGIF